MWRWLGVVIACTLTPRTAHSDTTLPGGATIDFGQLLVHEDGNPTLAPPSTADAQAHYFNLSHCMCSQPGAADPSYVEGAYAYQLLLDGATTPVHRPLEIWVGLGCDVDATRATQCHRIDADTIADLSAIPAAGVTPIVSLYDLMEPAPTDDTCNSTAAMSEQWAIADTTGSGVYDYFSGQPIAIDETQPPLPTGFAATSREGEITLSWTPPPDVSDIAAYQVLCAYGDGSPASLAAPPPPRYETPRQLCGESFDITFSPSPVDVGATAVDADEDVPIMQSLAQLDPSLICADVADPTASSVRIRNLPDNQLFVVMVLAIDHAGNASATYLLSRLSTSGTDDLWQDLGNHGSKARGGFCLVADTFGDDHPITQALRGFRDDTLATSALGRASIRAYYAVSRRLAPLARAHWLARGVAAVLLAPFVVVALAWQAVTLPGLVALVLAGVLLRRARRAWRVTRVAATTRVQ